MNAILTLVAADPNTAALTSAHFEKAREILQTKGILPDPVWLSDDKAADIIIADFPDTDAIKTLRSVMETDKIDVFTTAPGNRTKKLLLADMDSTIVAEETLDELAAFAGLKDQVAEITAKAMNGELDFHGAIRERVALLKGLSTDALEQTRDATIVNPGAKTLVETMKSHGATCVLVSGGFTIFTEAIAEQVGFNHHHGNTLGIEGTALTGEVIDPILDKHAKVKFLDEYCEKLLLSTEDAMTIGDGANDIPMLEKAGLGIGYKPKQTVAESISNCIIHGDLSTSLYAQGYRDSDIIKN